MKEMSLIQKTFYSAPTSHKYSFYLYEIDEPETYQDWYEVIRNAMPDDLIKIHINSPGGRIDTAIQLTRAINESQATVITSVEGECASAATLIFLNADMYEVTPHSMFMFHNYSSGNYGKGGELYDRVMFDTDWLKTLMKESYEHILTDEEFEKMLLGKDIYKTSEEMMELLNNRAEIRKEESEETTTEESEDLLIEVEKDTEILQ